MHTRPLRLADTRAHVLGSIEVRARAHMHTHTHARRDTCPAVQKQTLRGVGAHSRRFTISDRDSTLTFALAVCGFPGGEGWYPSGHCTQLHRLFSAGTGE